MPGRISRRQRQNQLLNLAAEYKELIRQERLS